MFPSSDFESPSRDRASHRARLIERIRLLGGYVPEPVSEDPSDLEIAFLERVVAWETSPVATHREWLARRGWVFPPPGAIEETDLHAELWRLIEALASARLFLEQTDHLTDAELYRHLWSEVLAADAPEFARSEAEACHWDVADAGNASEAWLTYYASEEDREQWAQDFPERPLPAHREPPARRDHRLPQRDQ